MTIPALAAIAIMLPFLGDAARASGPHSPRAGASETERLFHEGVRRYAQGDSAAALVLFREVARRDPDHRGARAAIRRLEAEAARHPPKQAPPPRRAGGLRSLLFETIPRWLKGGTDGARAR